MNIIDSRQEQMGNGGGDGNPKNQKEMLKFKTEMKNTFDELINRLDAVEERISEVDNVSIEFSKYEKQKEQRLKNTKMY